MRSLIASIVSPDASNAAEHENRRAAPSKQAAAGDRRMTAQSLKPGDQDLQEQEARDEPVPGGLSILVCAFDYSLQLSQMRSE